MYTFRSAICSLEQNFSMYKKLIRPVLFLLSAEKAHAFTFNMLRLVCKLPFAKLAMKNYYQVNDPKLERNVFGLHFKNPVGLAAGFDKDAKLYKELACFGFGFIEIGTVTPKPQAGNDKPRLFRLKSDMGIINRMGFNNHGLEQAIERLKSRDYTLIIGGNIGKNKLTPNENAVDDYLKGFHALYPYVDYFAVNVSSPNTPNLRSLQDKEPLTALLKALMAANAMQKKAKPIILKIAPDLTDSQLDDIIAIVRETGIQGIIATNTTISREGLLESAESLNEIGAGGVSGRPLTKRATEVIRYLHEQSAGAFPIIGVGGIHSPEEAREKIEAGASLVQVYTGFIYEGPSLVKRTNKYLSRHAANR